MRNCPCGSGLLADQCCDAIHEDSHASTALALMRSRYSAYVAGRAEYILETTHPGVVDQYDLDSIQRWADENDWQNLEIIGTEYGGLSDNRGIVEFKAYYIDINDVFQMHHEKSEFEKVDGKWYYLRGEYSPKQTELVNKISRNDPCLCGSGKKYKKCCGVD